MLHSTYNVKISQKSQYAEGDLNKTPLKYVRSAAGLPTMLSPRNKDWGIKDKTSMTTYTRRVNGVRRSAE
jgi:hypothetical protein